MWAFGVAPTGYELLVSGELVRETAPASDNTTSSCPSIEAARRRLGRITRPVGRPQSLLSLARSLLLLPLPLRCHWPLLQAKKAELRAQRHANQVHAATIAARGAICELRVASCGAHMRSYRISVVLASGEAREGRGRPTGQPQPKDRRNPSMMRPVLHWPSGCGNLGG